MKYCQRQKDHSHSTRLSPSEKTETASRENFTSKSVAETSSHQMAESSRCVWHHLKTTTTLSCNIYFTSEHMKKSLSHLGITGTFIYRVAVEKSKPERILEKEKNNRKHPHTK